MDWRGELPAPKIPGMKSSHTSKALIKDFAQTSCCEHFGFAIIFGQIAWQECRTARREREVRKKQKIQISDMNKKSDFHLGVSCTSV